MGYFNPIHNYGKNKFVRDAKNAGNNLFSANRNIHKKMLKFLRPALK